MRKFEIEEEVSRYLSRTIETKRNNRYTDAVRATYQDLVGMGVGTDNVEPVIKSVLDNLTNLKVDCFPKHTFACFMFTDSRKLSQFRLENP